MNILGISCFYHDSAVALLRDGELVAAAHEERFTRKRHDPDVPVQATAYCLAEAGIGIDDVDYLVFYDKPFVKFERILTTYLATFPRRMALHRETWQRVADRWADLGLPGTAPRPWTLVEERAGANPAGGKDGSGHAGESGDGQGDGHRTRAKDPGMEL